MNQYIASTILYLLVVSYAHGKSQELNPTTFADIVTSKNSFVKFYAPWCGHCKALAPDWDTLAEKYAASSSVAIVSVDCTADSNEDLCQEYGVQGYPTLKYYKDGNSAGEDYQGGRSLDELESFVDETLNKKCIVGSAEDMLLETSNCSEKEFKYTEKMRAKTGDEIKAQIDRLDKMKNDKMKPELKSWLFQRLHILNSLHFEQNDEF